MKYTKFRVTNLRGDLIADWVAEGSYEKLDSGYKIRAVERLSGPPYPQSTHYANGWRTTVVGPNIVIWPIRKPEWLEKVDREAYLETGTVKVEDPKHRKGLYSRSAKLE